MKRFWITCLAVFVVFEIAGALIHGPLLGSTYATLANVWRPEMANWAWAMHLVNAFLALMFVYIFTKGYENKGITEGVRYGLIIGLLLCIPANFYQYIVYPLPFSLIIQWAMYGVMLYVLCGIVAAAVYRRT